MSDPYAFWRAAVAGNVGPIHADQPQLGRYKMREKKGGPWLPVAIFMQDGALKAAVGKGMVDPLSIWTRCADNAVSEADYKHALANGAWPGEIGHNSGDLSLLEQVVDRIEQASSWLKKNGIKTKVDADTAANHRSAVLKLKKEVEAEWGAKEAPFKAEIADLKEFYKPLADQLEAMNLDLRKAVTVYGNAVEAAENARRLAEYEAQVKADRERRAKEEAERAELLKADPIAALTEPTPPPAPPPAPPEAFRMQVGGQSGKVTSMRTVTSYVVDDHKAALAYFAEHEDIKALVQKLAAKVAKTGVQVPGVSKKTERVAA